MGRIITVSYTHLDVYKRQELESIAKENRVCLRYEGVVPVSYTHLDVYKRQRNNTGELQE